MHRCVWSQRPTIPSKPFPVVTCTVFTKVLHILYDLYPVSCQTVLKSCIRWIQPRYKSFSENFFLRRLYIYNHSFVSQIWRWYYVCILPQSPFPWTSVSCVNPVLGTLVAISWCSLVELWHFLTTHQWHVRCSQICTESYLQYKEYRIQIWQNCVPWVSREKTPKFCQIRQSNCGKCSCVCNLHSTINSTVLPTITDHSTEIEK